MKRDNTYLKDLSVGSKFYGLRVKVTKKPRVQKRSDRNDYQHVTLEDEKGDSMMAILYGDDVEYFKDILLLHRQYKVGNASINRIPQAFRQKCGELQMIITNRTSVEVIESGSSLSQTRQSYSPMASIPQHVPTDKQYDLLVVVLYVGPVNMVGHDKSLAVCTLVVTDDRLTDTRIVCVWNDLAPHVNDKLAPLTETGNTPVVGLSFMITNSFKGRSFATSPSTLMLDAPEGEQADALKHWITTHSESLKSMMLRVKDAYSTSAVRKITTIEDVLSKKKGDIIQDEIFRVRVYITNFSKKNINLYIGCKKCGKKCGLAMNSTFLCEYCSRSSTAMVRMFCNFDATDGSGTLKLSAYTDNVERMFKARAEDFLAMTDQELKAYYDEEEEKFRSTPICLDLVAASFQLQQMDKVRWVLKAVVVD